MRLLSMRYMLGWVGLLLGWPAHAALMFEGSHHVVSPGAQVSVGLLVQDIVDLEALTAEVSFTSGFLDFNPARLMLDAGTGAYDLDPDDVVLGTLTAGFTPLLAEATPGDDQRLLASLAGFGAPVDGTGSLLLIPMTVAANTPAGDYFVDFACLGFQYVDPQGVPRDGCTDLAFPATRATITVRRQQQAPEPATLGLLGLGLVAFGWARARAG